MLLSVFRVGATLADDFIFYRASHVLWERLESFGHIHINTPFLSGFFADIQTEIFAGL